MATARKEIKEGNANTAEAAVTSGVEPDPQDVSTASNTGTEAEIKEGNANTAEAKRDKEKRMRETDEKEAGKTSFDMNAANRRISRMLQEQHIEQTPAYLAEQVRKLKGENARLKQQMAQLDSGTA